MFKLNPFPLKLRIQNLTSWVPVPASFRSRLGVKFLIIVFVTIALGTVLSSILILAQQHQQLAESTQTSVQRVSVAIQAGLEHAMLSNDKVMISQVLGAVASEAGFKRVSLVNMNGEVWLSAVPVSTGQVEPGNSMCRACHAGLVTGHLSAPGLACKISNDVLVHTSIIANQPACYSCHGANAPALGVLSFETPLSSLQDEWFSHIGLVAVASSVMFLLLAGLLAPALARLVIQPVVKLARGAREFGAGNLDFAANVDSHDELGDLSTAFDSMRGQLKGALAEKERRNRELQMLNEIARATNPLLDPQQVLNLTINIAVSSLGVEAGAIYLLDRECGRFSLHACQGMPECREMACQLWGFNRVLAGLKRPDSSVVSVPITAGTCYGMWQDSQGRSFVGVPLKAKGTLLGAMTLVTHPGQDVTGEGARILKVIGEEIGQALAIAIHFQDVRNRATLEERERLAREMHDSLAQALSYLKLQASVTADLLSNGQITQAQANLRQVKEIARETYVDVREAIFGLRHLASPGSEFLPALEEYLGEYTTHYGVPVNLILDDGCRPSFEAEVSLQLTRIIQEALANVRKHAGPNQVNIRFTRAELEWRLTVEDDGQGFDPRRVPKAGQQYLGLHIMRERAASIGSQLELDSVPGRGTTITIRIPFVRKSQDVTPFAYSAGR